MIHDFSIGGLQGMFFDLDGMLDLVIEHLVQIEGEEMAETIGMEYA